MIEKDSSKSENKKLRKAKKYFFFVLILIILYVIFSAGYLAGKKGLPIGIGPKGVTNLDAGKPANVDFSLFWEAWNRLKAKAVTDPDPKKMEDGAIAGLLSSMDDPYTVYFTKDENKRFKEDIGGQFDGIGIEIVQKNNAPTVVAPLADSPAEKAGLKPDDIILEVNGAKTSDIGFEETINRIRGQEGTVVKLMIIRAGKDQPFEIEVTRAKIIVKSVEWSTKVESGKKIFYIKLSQFGDDTNSLFAQAAVEIKKSNPDGIVLDLRNDPGGYLDTAVNIAGYFIKDGVIVSEKGRNNSSKDYTSTGDGRLSGYKTVVLANGGSASASEILAGALQDRNGIKIVGEKTFGKGSVQELIDLSDGSAVKITVAKWYTPGGRQITGSGIEPNIKVTNEENSKEDAQLKRALQLVATGQ